MAILDLRTYNKVELIPDRVDLPISMELYRNGVTSNESLPKNLSKKCNHQEVKKSSTSNESNP
ncbi:MAG: hypothetical protein R6W95_04720, partial [Desulfosarcina sp.]